MRMMMKVQLDTEAASNAIADGSLPRVFEQMMSQLNPGSGLLRARRRHAHRVHRVRPREPVAAAADQRAVVQDGKGEHQDVPGHGSR
jgi:hypothetical protein